MEIEPAALVTSIKALGRTEAWEQALQRLFDAKENNLELNVITFNCAIGACARAGKSKQVLLMLAEMVKSEIEADHFIYFNALSSCKRQRDQWPQALSFLLAAACSGITLEKGGYTEAVTMCSRAGVWRKAWEVFDEAVSRGVRPNTILRNSLVATHGEKGGEWLRVRPKPSRFRWPQAQAQLTEMQRSSIRLDQNSFASMLACCGDSAHWTGAIYFLDRMHQAVALTLPACTAAVIACVRSGEGPRGLRLLQQMVVSQILPDKVLYGGALAAAKGIEDWPMALSLMNHLSQQTFGCPDAACFVNAIIACAQGRQWVAALVSGPFGVAWRGEWKVLRRYTPGS
ncbi:unnamed protein product [Durusdinium trenchii]|uniref:Pentatricopeptide repeat-containing protein, chloroplastic n=3 Tax=Durusdinium trenchii TaxID=1381693 RepID=A0ABP0PT17_9DINO